MHTQRQLLRVAVAFGLLGMALSSANSAPAVQTVTPVPIPPGYNFPTPQATIDGWVAAYNEPAIRGHAWDLWNGMSAKSGQTFHGQNLPVWETWLGSEDVFPPATAVGAPVSLAAVLGPHVRALRSFVTPHQFIHQGVHLLSLAPGAIPAVQVVSFNKFDPDAATFIVKPQTGPQGQTFYYDNQKSLVALNGAWPQGTSGQNRTTNDFPITGIETKPVFTLVKATKLTPQPLWEGPTGSTNQSNPTPDTWTTCVLIDPKSTSKAAPKLATRTQLAQMNGPKVVGSNACKTYLYGSLSLFYYFKMTAAEAVAFNNAQLQPNTPKAVAGDFAVLNAMHVNTKETPFWTWQTFWWQPGPDAPGGFPGTKQGQPTSLTSPWNNYATCAAYNQTTTGTTMAVCFNPYLETSPNIPVGITSNCMSCHGVARVATGSANYPPAYKTPIPFFTDPDYFNQTTTHTDFSWAIANEAVPQ